MNKYFHIDEEAARCLLCADAPCSKACGKGDVARAIQAVRFGNEKNAAQWVKGCTASDLAAAQEACIHYDRPIRISEIMAQLPEYQEKQLPSLEIDFCGIKCENPFFLASSAICTNYEMVARAFDMGWAGVFYKTICLEDIVEVSPRFDTISNNAKGDFYGLRNMEQLSENPAEVDFDILRRLKQNYPTKIVVASIMGQNQEEWIKLAKMAEEAGADAVELNFSCPQMGLRGMGSDVGQNPELVLFYTSFVKHNVKIPVIAKMTPNITHMARPAIASHFGGAVGLLGPCREAHRLAFHSRARPKSRYQEYAVQWHWRHRDLARRPGIHPAGLPQRAGVHRCDAIWLPHHRRHD